MQLSEFIVQELSRLQGGIDRATAELTPAELKWQPKPEGNPVGWLLYHMARTEDRFVQRSLKGEKTLWETGGWPEKLDIDAADTGGFGYTAEMIAAFETPPLAKIQDYTTAAREKTLELLGRTDAAEFDRIFNVPPFGELKVGALWVVIVGHNTQHAGEIAYLRGLIRGMNQ